MKKALILLAMAVQGVVGRAVDLTQDREFEVSGGYDVGPAEVEFLGVNENKLG